jgi:hypothetical protein
MTAKMKMIKNDGWANLLSGFGVKGRDKRKSTFIEATNQLQENELNDLYRGDGLAKRIVNLLVEDMTRRWFTVENDTDGLMETEMRRLKVKPVIIRALRQSSLHGGSVIVMGIDDGGMYDMPVNERNIRKLTHFHLFDRWRALVETEYTDPEDDKFGKTETYRIQPITSTGTSFIVHESRVLRFDGSDVSDYTRRQNRGWNDSDLQTLYERIRGIAEALGGAEHLLTEFTLGIMQMNGLQGLIASGKEALVKTRLNMIDMSKHVLNTVLLDENETYSKIGSPVTGFPEILDKLLQGMSSYTGIPVTVLMGESPAGLNATGASDIRRYYDMIAARQEERMLDQMERLTCLVMLQREGEFGGRELEGWKIDFNSLWEPTDAEKVAARAQQATSDNLYVTMGALTPEEVAQSRFGGNSYSLDTKLGYERTIEEPEEIEEPEMPEEETPPKSQASNNTVPPAAVDGATE